MERADVKINSTKIPSMNRNHILDNWRQRLGSQRLVNLKRFADKTNSVIHVFYRLGVEHRKQPTYLSYKNKRYIIFLFFVCDEPFVYE